MEFPITFRFYDFVDFSQRNNTIFFMGFLRRLFYWIFMAFIRYIYNWIIIFLITVTFIREKVWRTGR